MDSTGPVRSVVVALSISLVPLAWPRQATAHPDRQRRTVAVVMLAHDRPDPTLLRDTTSGLLELSGFVRQLELLPRAVLARRLGHNPAVAIAACNAGLACIARVGRRARAKEIVVVHVGPAKGGGIHLQAFAVAVRSGKLARRAAFDIASKAALEAALKKGFVGLTGFSLPAGAALASNMLLGANPPASRSSAGTRAPRPPATPSPSHRHTGGAVAAEPLPTLSPLPSLSPLPTAPESAEAGAAPTAAAPPTHVAARRAAASSPSRRRSQRGIGALGYTGFVVAGIGAVGLVLTAVFGGQAQAAAHHVHYGPGGTSQLDARAIKRRAATNARLATIMASTGGAALAVGAGILALNFFVLDTPVRASTRLVPGGAAGRVVVSW